MYLLIVNGRKMSRSHNQNSLIGQGARMHRINKALHVRVVKDESIGV
jgi:hypothetical protein